LRLRKTILIREVLEADEAGQSCPPLTRVAALAVIPNPFAEEDQEDLSPLFEFGAKLGAQLAKEAVSLLGNPPVTYGKAAIVGGAGTAEHGAALLHPRFGKPVRQAIGGGEALMPSVVKVASLSAAVDLPIGHKDKPWSFDHIDTMTVSVPDGPRDDEVVVCLGLSDGARIRARVGKGPK